MGGESEKENLRRQRDAQNQATQLQLQGLDNILGLYGGQEAIQKEYNDYLAKLKGFDPTTTMGEFDQSQYNVQNYLDPSMKYQLDQANRTLQSSLQGQGGIYSGKAMKALQKNAQDYSMTDFGNAFNRMNTDRQFGYTDFINHFNNLTANKTAQLNQLKDLFNISDKNMTMNANTIGQKSDINAQNLLSNADIRNRINNANFKQMSGLIKTGIDSAPVIMAGASKLGGLFKPDYSNLSSPEMTDAQIQYNFDNANQASLDSAKNAFAVGGTPITPYSYGQPLHNIHVNPFTGETKINPFDYLRGM